MLRHHSFLFYEILRWHFLGITAFGLRILFHLGVHHQELAAKTFDLLLGRRTHVRRRHHRTEALGRGDGLQARDTDTHDEHLGRGDRARSGHHHRKGTAKFVCTINDSPVARQIGLRRQDIHALGTRNTRHQFHGEGGHTGLRASGHIGAAGHG